jgi:hypothetical protein
VKALRRRLDRLRRLGARDAAARITVKLADPLVRAAARRRDRRRDTALSAGELFVGATGGLLAAAPAIRWPAEERAALAGVTEQYLAHRFDLLGSGWLEPRHGLRASGLEGHRYEAGIVHPVDLDGVWLAALVPPAAAARSRRTWRLVDPGYVPIDWQRDFKSGYRWSERTWYRDVPYAPAPGVDVKVPWELARMQHVPQLALAHAAARDGAPGFAPPERYVREIRNQILDFVAANPVRFGVNWNMPMDVGIRVANWVLALELLRGSGAALDAAAEGVIRRSVQEHAAHLVRHLEWLPELRGNHYLADVVGLLFAAAWLPRARTSDAWLALAVQELAREVHDQFLPDGGNFEASTIYHRLSTEMALYGAALVAGLAGAAQAALRSDAHRLRVRGPKLRPLAWHAAPDGGAPTPFSPAALERLERAVEFTAALAKPDGRMPQVGDNDSGRFFKLRVPYAPLTAASARARYANLDGREPGAGETFWDEDVLNHRHLLDAAAGLFDREDWAAGAGVESSIVRALAGGRRLPSWRAGVGAAQPAERVRLGNVAAATAAMDRMSAEPGSRRRLVVPVPGAGLLDGLGTVAFPEFGLYLFRSARLYLLVRCGPVGQHGLGGHAHDDQLSVQLAVDGRDWIADPGTYLYTPLPARRDAYRSAAAHFAPRTDLGDAYRLDLGPFQLGGDASAHCEAFGPEGFVGVLVRPGGTVRAVVRPRADAVVIEWLAAGCRLVGPESDDWRAWRSVLPYSPGYGKLLRAPLPEAE